MNTTSSIADRVQLLRKHLNLSQEQLAAKLDVSFATVNRWETGKSKPQQAQLASIDRLWTEVGLENEEQATTATTGERRRRGVQRSTVLGTKGMEQMLWDAACSIRGEKDAPKFKDYLLPLLFIKRLSDVFDDEVERLTQTYGDKETAFAVLEADHELVRFYLPPEARWAVVSGREKFDWPEALRPKSLGEQLTTTIRAIVKNNPLLAGVIDIVDYNETRNGEREISDAALKGVIETYSDPRYRLGLHDVEPDFLGRCYEYLLRKFAEGQGQSAGEFFTPREIGFLMAEIIRPRPGEECYDYACGSFGLLIKLQLVSRRIDPLNKLPLKLYGQELTGSSYAIACMNRIIHDMEGEVVRGDSMRNPKFRDPDGRLKKFDISVANPMWSQPFDQAVFDNDQFARFLEHGGVTSGNGDWAWLEHTVASLKTRGRAAIVLDTGAVTRGSGGKNESKEKNIRKWFVDHDLVEGVILLPENLFYNTNQPGVVIIINRDKAKARKGKVLLVDASQRFVKGTPKNVFPETAIQEVAQAYLVGDEVPGLLSVATIDQVAEKDYNLLPSRYVVRQGEEKTRGVDLIQPDFAASASDLTAASSHALQLLDGIVRKGFVQTEAWKSDLVENCLAPLSIQRPAKILARDYKPTGRFPVVDQGQPLIGGWTDDESCVINNGQPYIIFGDHTRVFKYITFPFALGADGTQLIKPDERFDPLFFYYACLALRLPSRGYNRHFTLLKEQTIFFPDRVEQQRIAAQLKLLEDDKKESQRHQGLVDEALLALLDQLHVTREG